MSEKPTAYVRNVSLLTLVTRKDHAVWVCTATCLGQAVGQGRSTSREAAEEAAADSARALWRALDHSLGLLDGESQS